MLNTLVFSGGSFHCITFIGVLKYLSEMKQITNVKQFIGTSFGALIAFMMSLGYTCLEMQLAIKSFIDIQNKTSPDVENMINIFYNLGVDSGETIYTFLQELMFKKLGKKECSFIDFAKQTGKNLVVVACQVSNMSEVYFSVDTHPHIDVLKAIRASIAIPVVFQPVLIDDKYFIDAGLVLNFPITYITNNRLKDVLGLTIKSDRTPIDENDMNLATFLLSIADNCIRRINNNVEVPPNTHILNIPLGTLTAMDFNYNFSTMQFQLPEDEIERKIQSGYEFMRSYHVANGNF